MTAMRIVFAVFALLAGYLITTLVIMSTLPIPKAIVHNSNLVSAVVAVAFSFFILKVTANRQEQLLNRLLRGGIIGGVLGFALSFFGALLIYPDCNICPVMSIFFAPLGFVLGLLGGWLVWKKKSASNTG